MKTVMFAGGDATDRGLFQYARRSAGVSLNMVFERHAPEVISYLNGDGRFADRKNYPLPEILVLDLTKPRMNAWEVVDWLKARPEFSYIRICFIGTECDEPAVSRAKTHGPCFFKKPTDAASYVELVVALDALKSSAPNAHSTPVQRTRSD